MANLVTNKYFKSKDIRVFPSSFRGTYKSGTKTTSPEITFDPEARLNTEANFILPKANLGNDTYIVQYNKDKNKIAFMLCGYYFEILDVSNYLDDIAGKYLGLKLRQIALHDSDIDLDIKEDTPRTTSLLDSWEADSENILDFQIDDQYGFVGLKVLESELSDEGSDRRIKLFLADKSINQEMLLPEIAHGKGINTLTHGEGLIADYENQTAFGKYNSNKADNLFEIGAGTGEADFDRRNAFEVSANSTNINTNVDVKGTIVTTGSIAAGGKITSALTSSGDAAATLVTKSYIDNMIGGISAKPPAPPSGSGEGESYVSAISQSGAQVSSTLKKFDSAITSSSKNAPTSAAVAGYIDSAINSLTVDENGGNETFIQKISEKDGKISATSTAFAKTIDSNTYKYTNTAPTVWAVYDYIESIKSGLQTEMSDSIKATVDDLGVQSAGGSGKYLKTIEQEGGKIKSTDQAFDTRISESPTHENAPTSAAVKKFVEDTIKTVWETDVGFDSPSPVKQTDSLKNIILDAIYPIGSIYMYYVAETTKAKDCPEECPIKNTLGGTWTLIEAGRFLRAADADHTTKGSRGGSKDAIIPTHTHTVTVDGGKTSISMNGGGSKSGWFNVRAIGGKDKGQVIMDSDGTVFTLGNNTVAYGHEPATVSGWDGKQSSGNHHKVSLNIAAHQHTLNDPGHKHTASTSNPTNSASVTNANLPPYLTVYMWRRES